MSVRETISGDMNWSASVRGANGKVLWRL